MKLILHTLSLFILSGVCLAQGQSTEAMRSNFTISCLFWEGKPKEALYYREGERFHRLEFKQAQRSNEFSMNGMPVFELYRDAPDPPPGEPPYELLSQCKIPNAKKILFVVIPFERTNGTYYRVHAMDDSLTAFPSGSFRFVNYTSEDIKVQCGEAIENIPSLGLWRTTVPDSPTGGFVPFVLGNSSGEVIYGTRIFGQPSGRELVFIIPPLADEGTPRVKFISQLIAVREQSSGSP